MRLVLPFVFALVGCGPVTGVMDSSAQPDVSDVLEAGAGLDVLVDASPADETPGADVLEAGPDAPLCPDRDGDGHRNMACGGDDCNDSDRLVHPGADPRCVDADSDCDGTPDMREEIALVDRWCRENSLTASSRYEEGVQCVFAGRAGPLLYEPRTQPSCVGCRSTDLPMRTCSCWVDNTETRLCEPRL